MRQEFWCESSLARGVRPHDGVRARAVFLTLLTAGLSEHQCLRRGR